MILSELPLFIAVRTMYFAASSSGPPFSTNLFMSKSAASWSVITSHTPSQARINIEQSPQSLNLIKITTCERNVIIVDGEGENRVRDKC